MFVKVTKCVDLESCPLMTVSGFSQLIISCVYGQGAVIHVPSVIINKVYYLCLSIAKDCNRKLVLLL